MKSLSCLKMRPRASTQSFSPAPRRWRLAWLPLSLGLSLGCVGSIESGLPGARPPGPNNVTDPQNPHQTPNTPPMMTPPRMPDEAPVTGFINSAPGASSRFMRLSHNQWENTVRDLFRMSARPGLAKQFINEGLRSHFDNQGANLEVTNQLWFDYNKAADSLAKQIVRDPQAIQALLTAAGAMAGDAESRARNFIKSFGERAYRRPLSDAEVNQYLGLYRQAPTLVGGTDAFLDGIELVVNLFLQSPHFVYRIEASTQVKDGRIQLTDWEVASRLSYGLVGTMPDDALFAAARAGKLRTREAVLEHAKRLMDSPVGQGLFRDLHTQLMREVDPTDLARDPMLHPGWKAGIGADMKNETLAFVEDVILGQKLGVTELLTAPYTFANARIAGLYGKPAAGDPAKFSRIELDPTQRAGLYTQLGYLSVTATDFNPRPIKRGVNISENVLCKKVPPPPPEVNDPTAPPVEGRTNRQNFEAATEMPGTICIGCHQAYINPLGFAFENFDGMGNYRKDEKGKPINSSGNYEFDEGMKSFTGAVDMMKIMAQGRQVHECYSERLFEYVYGREPGKGGERGLIEELGRRSRLKVPVKNLILDLVATDAFLTRAP